LKNTPQLGRIGVLKTTEQVHPEKPLFEAAFFYAFTTHRYLQLLGISRFQSINSFDLRISLTLLLIGFFLSKLRIFIPI